MSTLALALQKSGQEVERASCILPISCTYSVAAQKLGPEHPEIIAYRNLFAAMQQETQQTKRNRGPAIRRHSLARWISPSKRQLEALSRELGQHARGCLPLIAQPSQAPKHH
jgi:hypothetical protein